MAMVASAADQRSTSSNMPTSALPQQVGLHRLGRVLPLVFGLGGGTRWGFLVAAHVAQLIHDLIGYGRIRAVALLEFGFEKCRHGVPPEKDAGPACQSRSRDVE